MAAPAWPLTRAVSSRLNQRQLRWFSLLLILLGWQCASSLLQAELLPAPAALVQRIVAEIRGGELLFHLGVTLRRVMLGFTLSMLLGSCLGLAMAHWKALDALLDTPLTILLNLPALIVIILCLLWIGLNDYAVVAAVVINKAPNVTVALREGGRALDRDLLSVARAFRLPPLRTARQICLPQLYPYLLAASRSGLSLVWKIVLVVELLGCSQGMGFQLGIFFQFFDIEGILAYATVFICLVLLLESQVLQRWERSAMGWRT